MTVLSRTPKHDMFFLNMFLNTMLTKIIGGKNPQASPLQRKSTPRTEESVSVIPMRLQEGSVHFQNRDLREGQTRTWTRARRQTHARKGAHKRAQTRTGAHRRAQARAGAETQVQTQTDTDTSTDRHTHRETLTQTYVFKYVYKHVHVYLSRYNDIWVYRHVHVYV